MRAGPPHKHANPGYRISYRARAEPKKRRNVKRRDDVTPQRVAAIPQLVLEGASIKDAASQFDALHIRSPLQSVMRIARSAKSRGSWHSARLVF